MTPMSTIHLTNHVPNANVIEYTFKEERAVFPVKKIKKIYLRDNTLSFLMNDGTRTELKASSDEDKEYLTKLLEASIVKLNQFYYKSCN